MTDQPELKPCEWLPIEDMPEEYKDGRWILFLVDDCYHQPYVNRWTERDGGRWYYHDKSAVLFGEKHWAMMQKFSCGWPTHYCDILEALGQETTLPQPPKES